ncbi:MAG: hypothetical protein WCT77_07785 [Bacteroidota bacterium]
MKTIIKNIRFIKFLNSRFIINIFFITLCLLPTTFSFGQENSGIHLQIAYTRNSDSTKMLNAKVTSSDGKPLKDIEVHFYVKRLFGLLPIESSMGNIPTDEKGETSIDLPKKDFPGDTAGNIVIVAKIEENSTNSAIETQSVMKIGVPLKIEKDYFPRTLWAPNAPFALILTFLVLIGGVWCAYSFVAFQVYKIKKAGKNVKVKLE